jgi:general secretion pathway protein E/type IV pilus assembly protein PilB
MTAPESALIERYLPLPEGSDQYPPEFSAANGAIKLREDDSVVTVGVAGDAGDLLLDTLRRFHRGKGVRFLAVDRSELAAYLGRRASEAQAPQGAKAPDERVLLDRLANDAPIVNLVNSLCIDGIRLGASDIHIEADGDGARVRCRVDGALRTVRTIEKERFPAVSSRIKVMANLNIMEKRLPQDGRVTVDIDGRAVDLRISIVPVAHGESIVLRLFNRSDSILGLEDLGFESGELDRLRRFLKIPHGLALVTGPTGSGKTTTLNAMLRTLPANTLKILTIEDPVECLIPGVNQIQTNDAIRLSFDTILRRLLRQDPDVIMVGEMRDSQTAELAARAALTGHLVLSTLHTNSAVAVLPRLRNMGLEPYLVAAVLRGAVAQRLVRRICPGCARERPASPAEARTLAAYGLPSASVVEGAGCELCGGTGFRGRVAVTEGFEMDDGLAELVLAGASAAGVASYLKERGMRSLARDGMEKAAAGITTIAELGREVPLG